MKISIAADPKTDLRKPTGPHKPYKLDEAPSAHTSTNPLDPINPDPTNQSLKSLTLNPQARNPK